jgi:hypothetical protein
MEYIKITTPKGSVHIVPEANNKNYYELLNKSIKDEKQQYKIEPYVAATRQSGKDGAGSINPVKDIDLSGKVVDLLPLISEFTDVEKLRGCVEAEKAAGNRVSIIKALQERIEELAK